MAATIGEEIEKSAAKEAIEIHEKVLTDAHTNSSEQGCYEIKVEQNTESWSSARKGSLDVRIGGSGMGAAAGLNQHCSRYKYFRNQLFGEEEEKDKEATERMEAACRHGHICEPYNAALYTEWTGNKVKECGIHVPDPKHNRHFQEGDDLYFAVSCDRVGEEVDLECKCPVSERSFQSYYEDRIDFSYLAQVHLQMAVRQRKRIHFMVTLYEPKPRNTYLLKKAVLYEIEFSRAFWDFIYERARDLAELMCLVASGEMSYEETIQEQLDVDTDITKIPPVQYRVLRKL